MGFITIIHHHLGEYFCVTFFPGIVAMQIQVGEPSTEINHKTSTNGWQSVFPFFFSAKNFGDCEYIQKACQTPHEIDMSLVTNLHGSWSLAGWLPVNKGLLFQPTAGTIETLTPFFGVGWLSIFRRCSIHVTLNIQKKGN